MRLPRATLLAALGFALAANVLAAVFVSLERTVYCWDFAGYWVQARTWSAQLASDPLAALGALLRSIRYDDYNLLPVVPLAPFLWVFGDSRLAYVLGLVNVYAVPAGLVLMRLCRGLQPERSAARAATAPVVAVLLLLLPQLWAPVLRGYVGIGGVLLAVAALSIYPRRRPTELRPRALLLLGTSLALLMVFRRWWMYWLVPYAVLFTIDAVVAHARQREGLPGLLAGARAVALVGLAGVPVAVLAWPFLHRALITDHADLYVAYAMSEGWSRVADNTGYALGLFCGGLLAAALFVLLRRRATRRLGVFFGAHLAATFALFVSVQSMGHHQVHLLLPDLVAAVGVVLAGLAGRPPSPPRLAVAGALVLGGLACSVSVLSRTAEPVRARLLPLVPEMRAYPLVRHDVEELGRLLARVDELVASDPDARFYVIAASTVFSAEVMLRAELGLGLAFRSGDHLLPTVSIDRRDGFPRGLLEASHLLVASPVQVGPSIRHQLVVVAPALCVERNWSFARAFEPLEDEFHLDDGVRVRVFRRTRPISEKEVAELSGVLQAVYPDRPFVYQPR